MCCDTFSIGLSIESQIQFQLTTSPKACVHYNKVDLRSILEFKLTNIKVIFSITEFVMTDSETRMFFVTND